MSVKYDQIGDNYNQTRSADPYLTDRIIHLLAPEPKGRYLDIGCGTGNYTIAIADREINMIGMDPSINMLKEAKQKLSSVEWLVGYAENTGIPANQIEGIIATLTLHHWDDLKVGFNELARVLKPGKRMVIFTATPQQMNGYWLNHYFPTMMKTSLEQMPSLQRIEEALASTGFSIIQTEKYQIKPDLEDLFLYSGKHRPQLYLDPTIRNGISSFASLSNVQEVEQGLELLEQDINSGKINGVIESYENEEGDYMFIVAEN